MAITLGDRQILETSPETAERMGWEPIHVLGMSLHSRSVHAIQETIQETAEDLTHELPDGETLVGFSLDAEQGAVIFWSGKMAM